MNAISASHCSPWTSWAGRHAFGRSRRGAVAVLAVACWMIAKDWRDIVPSRLRDTGTWHLGIHGRFAPLRALRYADGLPTLAGAITFAIGVVNLSVRADAEHRVARITRCSSSSRCAPFRSSTRWRSRRASRSSSTSFYLRGAEASAGRRASCSRRARRRSTCVKGLDFEETALSWAGAAVLWWGRESFVVRHGRAGLALALSLAAAASRRRGPRCRAPSGWARGGAQSRCRWLRNVVDLLRVGHTAPSPSGTSSPGCRSRSAPSASAVIVGAAYAFFRPLPPPREPAGPACAATRPTRSSARTEATRSRSSSCAATCTTCSASDGRAFLGYRVEGRILLVAGDPVGPRTPAGARSRDVRVREVRGLEPPSSVRARRSCRCGGRRVSARSTSATRRSSRPPASRSKAARSARCASRSTGVDKAGYTRGCRGARARSTTRRWPGSSAISQLWRAGAAGARLLVGWIGAAAATGLDADDDARRGPGRAPARGRSRAPP